MDFNFRAVDGRTRISSSSSSFDHMRAQAFPPYPHCNRPDPDQWEMEKAQIKTEIIATEIARRRMLEAEVRMELMLEAQMAAMHTATETGMSFEQRLAMRLDHRRPFRHPIDDNCHWRPEERFRFLSRPPLAPPMVSPPGMTELLDAEVKATPEANKDKLIILAKPNPTSIAGAKRKAPLLAGTGELSLPLFNLKNKPKDEWSCALCQVSATSEKGLSEHLQGKKHKARQARLRAETTKNNSNSNTTLLQKVPIKLAKVAVMPHIADSDSEDRGKLKSDEDELAVQKKKKTNEFCKEKDSDSLEKTHESTTVDKVEGTPELTKQKKFQFWCQICDVGTYSKVVMEDHNKGRKHVARLQQLEGNNGVDPVTTTNTVTEHSSPEGAQMPKDADVVTNEAKEKLMDAQEIDKKMAELRES